MVWHCTEILSPKSAIEVLPIPFTLECIWLLGSLRFKFNDNAHKSKMEFLLKVFKRTETTDYKLKWGSVDIETRNTTQDTVTSVPNGTITFI